jgi:DNA-directed RNA polymerase subunit RPC12/RpoP
MSESDSVHDLLVRGIAAAKSNTPADQAEARFYLEWVLRLDETTYDQQAEAWLWLSQIEDDPIKKRDCLENVIAIDPANPLARRGLAILDGQLKPQDVIDTRQPIEPVKLDEVEPPQARRYVCPKCGGQLAFDAATRQLRCSYCGNQLYEYQAITQGALMPIEEQNFFATLPTAKAHRWELAAAHTLNCQGCGATFTLPPLEISGSCPFCGSAHVIEATTSAELIQPEGVLPFQFDAEEATKHVRRWIDQQRFRPGDLDERSAISKPRGVYLPFWTFDLGGQINWSALVAEQHGRQTVWAPRNDIYLVYHNDLLVPGTHSLPLDLLSVAVDFDTVHNTLAAYSGQLLADWPAEIYQISMADASLVARQRALQIAREHVTYQSLGSQRVRDLRFNTGSMVIESFKLTLLPIWIGSYRYKGQAYACVVNGQTGKVAGQLPRSGFQKMLTSLFGGN